MMFQSVRGMQDILPTVTTYWESLEAMLIQVAKNYAYQEVRLPIIEKTALFQHSIGSLTDIIDKEMYHLESASKIQCSSLRPEGTAGCIRAAIQHKRVLSNSPQRLWYLGPMFRHERPQKGRYRQFHQFGIEAFGIHEPSIDVELICMCQRLWQKLGISHQLRLEINSLGSYETRQYYRKELIQYFKQHFDALDDDSKQRLNSNPLRILDSKNPKLTAITQGAPKLIDYLDEASSTHFTSLQHALQSLNISFSINPHLVRGLDYYNRTVFEWVIHDATNTQNTICAGGRYDGLIQHLGGPNVPAIGFAIGLERLLELWMHSTLMPAQSSSSSIYIMQSAKLEDTESLRLAEELRNHFPLVNIEVDCVKSHFSKQFKRANARKAFIGLVLGEDEVNTQTVTLKHLACQKPQSRMTRPQLIDYLKQIFNK